MAGYLFLLGEIKDANDKVIKNANAIYNEVFSTGTYSTRMYLENTLKAGNWSQSRAKQSTFTDYLGMKENDYVFFFFDREIHGMGKLVNIGEDCKYWGYIGANKPEAYSENQIENVKLFPEITPDNRCVCFFKPVLETYNSSVDMDEALTSYPNAFKALRVIDGRSFIKMDDEESFALAALIRRRTNSSKTIAFENQIHRIVYEKVSKENQYFLTAKSILQTYPIVNKDGICSEQMVEAAAIERLSKENRLIKDTDCLQRWDYVCHQVSASPFKPIKYMEWIDIFGYRKSAWDEEIGIPVPFSIDKYLVVEIKKDYLREKDAAAVTQVMKYVDWVTRKYANNIYPMVTAYIIANGFDEDFKRSCRETGIRNYNLGYRNSQPQTWMDIKLIKYSFDGQEISFVEVPNV